MSFSKAESHSGISPARTVVARADRFCGGATSIGICSEGSLRYFVLEDDKEIDFPGVTRIRQPYQFIFGLPWQPDKPQ